MMLVMHSAVAAQLLLVRSVASAFAPISSSSSMLSSLSPSNNINSGDSFYGFLDDVMVNVDPTMTRRRNPRLPPSSALTRMEASSDPYGRPSYDSYGRRTSDPYGRTPYDDERGAAPPRRPDGRTPIVPPPPRDMPSDARQRVDPYGRRPAPPPRRPDGPPIVTPPPRDMPSDARQQRVDPYSRRTPYDGPPRRPGVVPPLDPEAMSSSDARRQRVDPYGRRPSSYDEAFPPPQRMAPRRPGVPPDRRDSWSYGAPDRRDMPSDARQQRFDPYGRSSYGEPLSAPRRPGGGSGVVPPTPNFDAYQRRAPPPRAAPSRPDIVAPRDPDTTSDVRHLDSYGRSYLRSLADESYANDFDKEEDLVPFQPRAERRLANPYGAAGPRSQQQQQASRQQPRRGELERETKRLEQLETENKMLKTIAKDLSSNYAKITDTLAAVDERLGLAADLLFAEEKDVGGGEKQLSKNHEDLCRVLGGIEDRLRKMADSIPDEEELSSYDWLLKRPEQGVSDPSDFRQTRNRVR